MQTSRAAGASSSTTSHGTNATAAEPPPPRRMSLRQRVRRDRVLLLAALPGITLLLVFQYLPLLGNVIAFKDYQPYLGINGSPWAGLRDFAVIFNGDPAFVNALENTVEITLLQVLVAFPVPIALALMLDSLVSERVKRIVQSVLYLPHFLSWVIVVAIFQQTLGDAGLLNTFLRGHDLATVHVVGNATVFKEMITAQALWKDAGWSMILFLAALSRIDPGLYEAAAVDGASHWRRVWHVSLPGLRGIIVLLLILRLGESLTVGFEQIVLQQGGVGIDASEVLDTYVFNNGIQQGDWGAAAAVGLVKGAVGLLLVLGANKVAHRLGEQGIYQR
ncbi:ABC transporter permease [Streptomyces polygonati]|uniref:ABC transporter permease n=1 Tax=Streptomyces polygonati TaxID=1617087 RepID=A0ABV8HX70_9ACTN